MMYLGFHNIIENNKKFQLCLNIDKLFIFSQHTFKAKCLPLALSTADTTNPKLPQPRNL